MIRLAEQNDMPAVKRLWQNNFLKDDGGYTSYFFEHFYADSLILVDEEGGVLRGCACSRKHQIYIRPYKLDCSVIFGVAVDKKYRHKGIMHALMERMLEETAKRGSISLIQSYEEGMYSAFGFEDLYLCKEYRLKSRLLPERDLTGVEEKIYPRMYLRLYQRFVSHYNGSICRNEKDIISYMDEVRNSSGRMLAYREYGRLKGLISYFPRGKRAVIEECLYLDLDALTKLLAALKKNYNEVVFSLSAQDNPERFLTGWKPVIRKDTSIMIHDPQKLSRIMGYEVKKAEDLFRNNPKPLFFRENK